MRAARISDASRGRRSTHRPAASRVPVVAGLALVLFTFLCYWPLTRFFLAQDDFVLLERASHGMRDAMVPFFDLDPGQFRPLTKGLYFRFAWSAFGLDPLPYHVVSIAVHALNAILAGAVLRRLGISSLVSWLAAFVFAAHLCHIEAVAWASCIQQLAGGAFGFAALLCGLDAIAGRGKRRALLAAAAYLLALTSYEQTLAVPIVLLCRQWLQDGPRQALRGARTLGAMWVVLAAYLVYVFLLRGLPDDGPYAMRAGSNVIANLREYASLAVSVWHIYPAYGLSFRFGASMATWAVLAALHAVLRSHRDLLFGCAAFLAFLAPVLFTTAHTHSFHLYLPEIGVCFLLASVADSLRRLAGATRRQAATAVLIAATVVVAAGSVAAVRTNVAAIISPEVALPRIFVLRRAVLAERMCADLQAKWGAPGPRLVLAYPFPQAPPANWRNVQSALGYGSAVRLALNRPGLEVVFVPPAEMPDSTDPSGVIVYTELGRAYTLREWQRIRDGQR
jgi:hypothetical protein